MDNNKYQIGDIVYDKFVKIHALIEDIKNNKYYYSVLESGKRHDLPIKFVDNQSTLIKVG